MTVTEVDAADNGTWHIITTDTKQEMVDALDQRELETDRVRDFRYDSANDQYVALVYYGYTPDA